MKFAVGDQVTHDVYGLGDPQITYTADAIRLELTTTTALPRDVRLW